MKLRDYLELLRLRGKKTEADSLQEQLIDILRLNKEVIEELTYEEAVKLCNNESELALIKLLEPQKPILGEQVYVGHGVDKESAIKTMLNHQKGWELFKEEMKATLHVHGRR